ncbi:hypothetical protein CPB85DRAFT_1374668 [Mucidula mucida]|nr:hypothetical protein CPB85DRAFT_1374668 [Mucidula mucida]
MALIRRSLDSLRWPIFYRNRIRRTTSSSSVHYLPRCAIFISAATVAVTWVILLFLAGIVQKSNTFERILRFIILLTKDWKNRASLGDALLHSTAFWLMVAITVFLAPPWMRLRKVPVANEWHAFANFPVPGTDEFSVVISQAGGWTTKIINDPPKEIWICGTPVSGVLRVNILFRRVVFVATGSGIGPIAPCLLERRTFGDGLVNTVLEAEPGAVIYDTHIYGRPDMMKLTYKIVQDFEAEAVVIISNEPLTRKLVYGLMSRGVPAFGAIWDS